MNLLQFNFKCHFPKDKHIEVLDKRIIRSFLRGSKYNMDKAKKKLECNFTVRHLYPDIFSGRSIHAQDVLQALDTVAMMFLPKFTENGNKVWFFKLIDTDSSRFDVYATAKLFFMGYDLSLTSEHPIAGEIIICDGSGVSADHFIKLLTTLKIIVPILRQTYPTRLKEIHIVNSSPLLDKILSLLKPFLHQKVKNAFKIHSSNKSLCDYFGEDMLPTNYGGKCKSQEELTNDYRKILNDNEKWFSEQESVKITEMIPKKAADNFYFKDLDVQGSFRSLQID